MCVCGVCVCVCVGCGVWGVCVRVRVWCGVCACVIKIIHASYKSDNITNIHIHVQSCICSIGVCSSTVGMPQGNPTSKGS